jgi:hypothetical protein
MQEIENGFRKVANYLSIGDARFDPNVESIDELSERTGAAAWVILLLLREKRVVIRKPLKGGLTCRYCREPIALGDACDECSNKLAAQLATSKSARLPVMNPGSAKKYGVR